MKRVNNDTLFNTVYKEFAAGIVRFIYFRVSDFEVAEELTADTFVRFWKHVIANETIRSEKALLYTIARGLVIDYYREGKKKKTIALDEVDERLLSTDDKTEDKLTLEEDLVEIFKGMKKIKKDYQEALLLHYVEDLTTAEIAKILEKKENAVRVLLHRALKALKDVL